MSNPMSDKEMKEVQKSVFSVLIGKQANGKNSYTGRFTIDEMNAFLEEYQKDLERVKNTDNKRYESRLIASIAGVAQALVYASRQGSDW